MLDLGRVDQLSIVVSDIDEAMRFYGSLLRVSKWVVMVPEYAERTYMNQPGNYKVKAALARFGNVELELVQPLEGESANRKHLEKYGEGIHHIGFSVPDFEEARTELEGKGFRMIQSGKRPGAIYGYFQKGSSIIFEIFHRWQEVHYE